MAKSKMRSIGSHFTVLAALAAACLGWGLCAAQGFPTRAIHMVVPYGPGGAPDVLPRVIGKKLTEELGWQIVIDNRPGAGGLIACELVAKAAPDGYTLLVAGTSQLALNPAFYPRIPYDPIKDFSPITLAVSTPLFLVANAQLPVRSVKDLIDYARANPGVHFGSSGNGSIHQLGMELFKLTAGVRMEHVPFKGVAQSIPAILSGDIAVMLVALPSVLPHVKSGKLRILGAAGERRSALVPELPTIAEQGLAGYAISTEIGFMAPVGTPEDIVDRLSRQITTVLTAPDVVRQLTPLGIDTIASSPAEYRDSLRPNLEKYARLIKLSGAKID